jgi:hypothetical protein
LNIWQKTTAIGKATRWSRTDIIGFYLDKARREGEELRRQYPKAWEAGRNDGRFGKPINEMDAAAKGYDVPAYVSGHKLGGVEHSAGEKWQNHPGKPLIKKLRHSLTQFESEINAHPASEQPTHIIKIDGIGAPSLLFGNRTTGQALRNVNSPRLKSDTGLRRTSLERFSLRPPAFRRNSSTSAQARKR